MVPEQDRSLYVSTPQQTRRIALGISFCLLPFICERGRAGARWQKIFLQRRSCRTGDVSFLPHAPFEFGIELPADFTDCAVSDGLVIDSHHRHDLGDGAGQKHFVCRKCFFEGEELLDHRKPQFPADVENDPAGDAGQNFRGERMREQGAAGNDEQVGARSFADDPLLRNENGVVGTGIECRLFGHRIGQELDGLDVASAPAVVRESEYPDAVFPRCGRRFMNRPDRHDDLRLQGRSVVGMVSGGDSPGNLHVNRCSGDGRLLEERYDGLADGFDGYSRKVQGDHGPFESFQMEIETEQLSVVACDDFVYGIGKLVTAVFDGNGGFGNGHDLPIHIGELWHEIFLLMHL